MAERKKLKPIGIRRTSKLDNGNYMVYYIDRTEDELTKEELLYDEEN